MCWLPQVIKKASGFGPGCWIGFSDNEQVTQLAGGQQSKGSFRWSDGSTVDYAAWVFGQPTGGWGDDPVGVALASGSGRNTDDHVMLSWEAYGTRVNKFRSRTIYHSIHYTVRGTGYDRSRTF